MEDVDSEPGGKKKTEIKPLPEVTTELNEQSKDLKKYKSKNCVVILSFRKICHNICKRFVGHLCPAYFLPSRSGPRSG